MAGAVLIGIKGEKGLWLADLEKGTVVRYTRRLSGDLAKAEAWRAKGVRVEKDVDFAVALTSASVVASGLLEG
ncbi:hypothetical protein [Rhizobium sp. 11515TR]|jgi:hypothetical protein|uniref:hypothetical protein n=1 Tax=unclassified Rhizobium TaxID=2613769 RepID=UPI000BA84FF5|nr:hypothetical protein [Rhizobium sp. 11515TR]ASW10030.1 hypothetical protein CKA34_28980 [Rhizobium sp. 11515TR]